MTSDAEIEDCNFVPPKRLKPRNRNKRTVMSEAVCSALDRYKISDRAAMHVILPTIEALGHDPNEIDISRNSINNARKSNREICFQNIKQRFSVRCLFCINFFQKYLI